MEFFFAVFFLLFYYIRPQDWMPGLAGANLVKPIIGIWVIVLIAARSRPAALPGAIKTPHDWIILAYLVYVAWTAPDFMSAFTGFLPLAVFYALTVQSVNSWDRLLSYLKWWNGALITIAVLALGILVGIDVTGGKEYTETYVDRLCLGTWLHSNPNSLGHSVVVALPLSYFLFFWRGSINGRMAIFPLFATIAYFCVYETESKGAFLVGGVLVALVFIVGRPKFVQAIAIVTAMTLGVGALNFLPRMSEMGNLRANEGVQGRLMAWEIARGVTKHNDTGEGWKQFMAFIDWKEGNHVIYDIPKSTHSSYVQVGADLGKYGLLIYLAGLWTAIHTIFSFRPKNETEDRCRRAIIVLLAANLMSGWMINIQYHTEYFLIIASAAALHRLRKRDEIAAKRDEIATTKVDSPEAAPDREAPSTGSVLNPDPAPAFTLQGPSTLYPKPLWNRLGIFDLAVCIGLTYATFWTWDYILENI